MIGFMEDHDESEVCVIQNDYDDTFNPDRVAFYGVSAWPTITGNGMTDVWPIDCIEGDYAAQDAIPSPMTITISEESMGNFTAHLYAEEDIIDADFFMVATIDEEVQGSSGMSRLPHHVKVHMTPPRYGDPFTLLAGESVDISHSFTVESGWDYAKMGVAAWVSRPGGTNTSPCSYGNLANMNEVLQSLWIAATPTGIDEMGPLASGVRITGAFPNPFNPKTTISFAVGETQSVRLSIHDISGKEIVVLADRVYGEGEHTMAWDGRDSSGQSVASGVYFTKIESANHFDTQKLMLLK
jgi:hypothetical protein